MVDRVEVELKHESTGQVKTVKVGLAWPMLWGLLSVLFIPCFVRRLYAEGGALFLYSLVSLMQPNGSFVWLTMASGHCVLTAIFIRIGNELTAKTLLQKGYVFSDPESDVAQKAQRTWGLPNLQPTKGDAWKLVLFGGERYRARKAYISKGA